MDDPRKDILDMIKGMILNHMMNGTDSPVKKGDGSPIIGVKVVMTGGDASVNSMQNQQPIEVFEDDTGYTLQTELPGGSSAYSLSYEEGKLKITTGEDNEYVADIPLAPIMMEKTESALRNGVLEIICYKQPQTNPVNAAE